MATKTVKQGRPHEMPDPDDRSPNSPHIIVERKSVLGLYNQAHSSKPAKVVSETVRKWFDGDATGIGWADTTWVDDNTVMLRANIVRK